MPTEDFFVESSEQSRVKAMIVEKYFDAWAGIITATQDRRPGPHRIGYVDLFAGPGRYQDGAASTPLRVLQRAIAKPVYAERLVTIFNDRDGLNTATLQAEIDALPGIERLRHKPIVRNQDVGSGIAAGFGEVRRIPVLAFIDPWGYRGLTLGLVDRFLRDWGCDCIFFFNYARINAGLSNPLVHEHMCALFGDARAAQLRDELEPMDPPTREATVVNALADALKAFGHRFVLPFCFKNESGRRSKHHLILVTKHFRGYEVMKEIMARSSSVHEQGVPSFAYAPAASRRQALLFELNRPLDDLRGMLLADFAGKSLTTRAIYEAHSVDRPFMEKNYKEALTAMETAGTISTAGRKSMRGFADNIVVTFPSKGA